MTRSRLPGRLAGACALALLAAASAPAGLSAAAAQQQQCFRAQDWRGSSSGGPRELYIRTTTNEVWRLDLAQDCPGARFPGPVTIGDLVSGPSNLICSGVDLQITVAPRGSGAPTACIVKSIQKLTADQAKALPPKAVP